MGCDIHVIMEIKNQNGEWKKWEDIPENLLPIDRDYEVFSKLFGVRGNDCGIIAHKGWPEDRELFLKELKDLGYHSFSYINYEDILKIKWPKVSPPSNDYFRIFCEFNWPRLRKFDNFLLEYKPTRMLVSFDS